MAKYPEYKNFSLPEIDKEILALWEQEKTFQKSVEHREGNPSFTFYEGPPSANGMPGIHHVMARTVKDVFCRYKTLKGFQVKRKGGWDTHGLPIELQVEKTLGITKDDIGKTISIEEYNAACRKDVLKFKNVWDDITNKMGYWVDLDNPYITFENEYIESVWHLLKRLYEKDYLYKGFTIQPYSPMAGTGLSSHELNQPGCYRNVKDTSAVAAFKVTRNEKSAFLFADNEEDVRILAWTTTPWTLPSNTALAVGEKITYVKVKTFNPFSFQPQSVVLAKDLMGKYFSEKAKKLSLADYKANDKEIPFEIETEFAGKELVGIDYEQLLPYVQPEKPAFKVLHGDFVSTTDGTGVVHIAPTFGSDDFRVAMQNDIPPMMVRDEEGNMMPLVDKRGRFVAQMGEFADEYVKADYLKEDEKKAEIARLQQLSEDSELNKLVKNIVTRTNEYLSVDERIVLKLQLENKLFKKEKYEHSYPHCWRTDKPVLYYPLDSWFVRTTAAKEKLVEHNKKINWKPAATGSGRFGNWLENLVDWNLSRSRYWGIPLPIWRTEDRKQEKCIGSVAELKVEIEKAVAAGFMESSPYQSEDYDLHRPYIDKVILVSETGEKMYRETDLIDVWFDSGSMPFAQWHYPFENQAIFNANYPADFIAEGVDQTRGWFFTLHAISVMLEDSVAFKNVIANGLVLDEKGEKMSKSKGNVVNPFLAIDTYGADAVRWYMISNSDPWENLKFSWKKKSDEVKREGKWKDLPEYSPAIEETTRAFFGTLYNTYNFFALYANVDNFEYGERVAVAERSELDRWIISCLNTLVKKVDAELADYEPTRAVRLIEEFVTESLSNWYVRLSRRVFWKGELNQDKIAAYQTLHECLRTIAILMSAFAPFYSEKVYRDLTGESVHLADFPVANEAEIDLQLEEKMEAAQRVSSLTHSIRKKVNIKVRQPLQKILIPVLDEYTKNLLEDVKEIILSEVNVKELAYITDDDASTVLVKKAKPNFKLLGPKLGGLMKEVGNAVNNFSQNDIRSLEVNQKFPILLSNGTTYDLLLSEVEITSQDVEGWSVTTDGKFTVALDIHLNESLKNEGVARELVNRIQNIRKNKGFDLTDTISIQIESQDLWNQAFAQFKDYICTETLCQSLNFETELQGDAEEIEVFDVVGKIMVKQLTVA